MHISQAAGAQKPWIHPAVTLPSGIYVLVTSIAFYKRSWSLTDLSNIPGSKLIF